jgi:uncharacterized protein (TIGR03435 family)
VSSRLPRPAALVEAKADCSRGYPRRIAVDDSIQAMLKNRSQLKAHRETGELPVYNLVAASLAFTHRRSRNSAIGLARTKCLSMSDRCDGSQQR